jgi:hypothetical protein
MFVTRDVGVTRAVGDSVFDSGSCVGRGYFGSLGRRHLVFRTQPRVLKTLGFSAEKIYPEPRSLF